MIKLKILSVGKTKEAWLADAFDEYLKRLTPVAKIETVWVKSDEQLEALIEQEPAVVCLDAGGTMMSSEEFSQFLQKQLEEHGARLTLVIGGSDGVSEKVKRSYPLVSFSRLTFTHQIIRLMLMEQIYRAFEIARGSKYHK
jgi:23S rRNA (pseudouridine1915-N3)-methyltransferase